MTHNSTYSYICLNCNTKQPKQPLPYKCVKCGVKRLVLIDNECSIVIPLQQITYHTRRIEVLSRIESTPDEYIENVLHAANAIEQAASHIKYMLLNTKKQKESKPMPNYLRNIKHFITQQVIGRDYDGNIVLENIALTNEDEQVICYTVQDGIHILSYCPFIEESLPNQPVITVTKE